MRKEVKKLIANVKYQIGKGNTQIGIELLQETVVKYKQLKSIQNELTIISNSFFEYKKKERLGILPVNDNSLPVINSNIMELLEEMGRIDFKEDITPAQSIIRQIFLANSPEELERIKFEAEKEKKKNPDDYEIYRAYEMSSKALKWEARGIPRNKNGRIKNRNSYFGIWIGGFLILVIIVYGIYQLIK